MRYINSRWLWLLAVNCIRDFQSESEREYHERRMEWREGERARHCGRVRRGGWMRINQSGVLPMQPSNPHIRENSPRMLPHSPLGLSRSLSTDASPPFLVSRLGYTAWRIEVRAIYHWRGKSARHRPYPNSDDFVRRLSTISPLFARRQEEAAAPISRRNETNAPFLRPL